MGEQLIAILILIGLTILVLRLFPPKNLLNDNVAIAEIVFSSILLFSFFLTWFSWGTIFSISLSAKGYEIPIKIKQWLQTEDFITDSDKTALYVSYLVYLIPIFSVATIITSSLKQNKTANLTARFASLIPFFCFLILLLHFISGRSSEKNSPIQYIDFGFYLMILSGVGLWISALRTSKLAQAPVFYHNEPVSPPNQQTVSEIDKTALLSQLEKLHSLKEKGVLTEEIYEQERQTILSQLQNQNATENIQQPTIAEEENTSTIEEYNPEYEELFGKETWFRKNKTWVITSAIILSAFIIIFTITNSTSSNHITNESLLGKWQFEKAQIFPSTASFSEFEKLDQEAARLTFTFIDTNNVVITERINLDKKWSKTKLETYKYEFKVSQDSILQLYQRETEHKIEIPIIKADPEFLILKISPSVDYSRKEGDYFHYTFKHISGKSD